MIYREAPLKKIWYLLIGLNKMDLHIIISSQLIYSIRICKEWNKYCFCECICQTEVFPLSKHSDNLIQVPTWKVKTLKFSVWFWFKKYFVLFQWSKRTYWCHSTVLCSVQKCWNCRNIQNCIWRLSKQASRCPWIHPWQRGKQCCHPMMLLSDFC